MRLSGQCQRWDSGHGTRYTPLKAVLAQVENPSQLYQRNDSAVPSSDRVIAPSGQARRWRRRARSHLLLILVPRGRAPVETPGNPLNR